MFFDYIISIAHVYLILEKRHFSSLISQDFYSTFFLSSSLKQQNDVPKKTLLRLYRERYY